MSVSTIVKGWAKRALGYDRVTEAVWRRSNPYVGTPHEWGRVFDPECPTVGILYDIAHEHQHYIKACHELRVSYRVFDLRGPAWVDEVVASGVACFLVWPTIFAPIHKQFWDDRLYMLAEVLGKRLYPEYEALWLYESKRRTADWLRVHGYAFPKTEVFFDRTQALDFVKRAPLPLVYKSDQGAASSGVYILRSRRAAERIVRQAFGRGVSLKNRNPLLRHQGYVLFQEYLPECKEWRLIRVGDSYFCRYKIRKGDFHSGSGKIEWAKPPQVLLDVTRELTERCGFTSLNIDFFETTGGSYLINELHALWGGRVLEDREREGRYRYDPGSGWYFESGNFFRNRCANLRVERVLQQMGCAANGLAVAASAAGGPVGTDGSIN